MGWWDQFMNFAFATIKKYQSTTSFHMLYIFFYLRWPQRTKTSAYRGEEKVLPIHTSIMSSAKPGVFHHQSVNAHTAVLTTQNRVYCGKQALNPHGIFLALENNMILGARNCHLAIQSPGNLFPRAAAISRSPGFPIQSLVQKSGILFWQCFKRIF